MSKLRSIDTVIWSDTWFEDLESEQKLIFIYLITNEKTNMVGVYEASSKKIAFETGVSKELVDKCLQRFSDDQKVKRVDKFIVLLNFIKHQKYNPNMMKSAIDTFNNLPDLIKGDSIVLCKKDLSNSWVTLTERLGNHCGMVPKIEVEVEEEIEVELETEIEVKTEIEKSSVCENANLLISSDEKPKTKKSSKAKTKEPTLGHKCRLVFDEFHESEKGNTYYWTPADAKATKQLIEKLKKALRDQDKGAEEKDVLKTLKVLLPKIKEVDSWIYDNLSMKIINSKWNEIFAKIKNGKANNGGSKNGPMGPTDAQLMEALERKWANDNQ